MSQSSMHPALRFFLSPGAPDPSRARVALRAAIAFVFVTSGALKLVYENQGPARFAKIGLPPSLAYFVAAVEIACGVLLLVGLFTRLAALPLVIDMIVAVVTTKLPLLTGAGPEPVAAPPKTGVLAFAYQARLDLAMLLACGYIVAVGAGLWSLDAWLARKRAARRATAGDDVRPEGGVRAEPRAV